MSRFVLGNCIDVMARIPDNAIDFILTDPPYLVGFRDRSGRTIAGDKTDEWLQPACNEMFRVLKKERVNGELLRLEPRRSLYGRLEKCGIQRCWSPGLHQNYTSKAAYVGYRHECATSWQKAVHVCHKTRCRTCWAGNIQATAITRRKSPLPACNH